MEPTLEGADAVHRVKRGRPAKAAPVTPEWATQGVVTPAVEAPVVLVDMTATFARADAVKAAQAYALRIWDGQSVDVSIPDRVERVVNGLRGQGLSIAVTLPHPDAARYLAKHA